MTVTKLFSTAVLAAVAMLFVSPVSASVWTNNVSYNNITDVIQDNSVSTAILDVGGPLGVPDGVVGIGDVVAGIIKWNNNNADGNPIEDHAIAVFSAQITATSSPGPSSTGANPTIHYTLGAAPAGFDLNTLLPVISASVGGFAPNSIAVVLSANGGTDPTTQNFLTALTTINTSYAADLLVGLSSAADFFEAELRDKRTIPAGGGNGVAGADGIISITDSDGDGFRDEWDGSVDLPTFHTVAAGSPQPGIGQIGFEAGGFTVLADYTGPGPSFYGLLPTTTLAGGTTGSTQFILSETTSLIQPTVSQATNGYAFADQSLVAFNASAVPEPASVLVWSCLAAVISGCVARRRN